MKIKKALCAVLSTAICCSFLTANVTADEFENRILSENSVSVSMENEAANTSTLSLNALANTNNYRLEDIENGITPYNGISEESVDGISTYSNSAPVAGLKPMLANSDSITPDGKATTDTIMYWLWNDGEYLYTYDPDGDEITDRVISGVYESIENYVLGTVSAGGEVIGFATKFTSAAQYTFEFYVKDSYGNKSNTVRYNIEIEPADGNKRPVCSLKAAGLYAVNAPVMLRLSDSYDADSSDSVYSATILVDTGNGFQPVLSNSTSAVKNDVQLTFPQEGTFGIAASVADNHNNRSNWVTGSVTISRTATLNAGETWSDSMTVKTKRPVPGADYTYEQTVSHTLTIRLEPDIIIDPSQATKLTYYENHNGIYYDVYSVPIPVGTLFSCHETWVPSSAGNGSNHDPLLDKTTPRNITEEDILTLEARGEGYHIIYNSYGEIIDFNSYLNPLIASDWSITDQKKEGE